MNVIQRIFGVIFSPVKTMADISKKSNFAIALIIIIAITTLFSIITYSDYKDFAMDQAKLSIEKLEEKGTDLPEKSKEAILEMSKKTAPITPIITIVSSIVMFFILAGISMLFLKVILKGEGTFISYLSVIIYASIVGMLGILLKIGLYLYTKDYTLVIYCTTLRGILPNNNEQNFINTFTTGIEIFNIWSYIIIGIGLKAVSKLSTIKVVSYISGIYIIYMLFMLLSAAGTLISG
ncbi:MAG: YIP1 family protein [Clostridiales bacterium]